MVQKERTTYNVIAARQWIFENVRQKEFDVLRSRLLGSLPCDLDRQGANIATMDFDRRSGLAGTCGQRDRVVSAATRQIKHAQRARINAAGGGGDFRPHDRRAAAQHVDAPQSTQGVSMQSPIEIGLIHQLRLESTFSDHRCTPGADTIHKSPKMSSLSATPTAPKAAE